MTISFNDIPTGQLTPFVSSEFDNTKAQVGPNVENWKGLLLGQRTASGTIAEKVLKRITSPSQAANYFGKGSLLHDMARGWFENNLSQELWAMALDDAGSGVAASGSFAVSGTATEAGSIAFYIAGERVEIGVDSGDTGADIATALKTELALSKWENLPVVFGGSSGTVDIVAKNEGEFGNEMDLRVNHYEAENNPSGISVVVTQPVSGATNPDIDDALAELGDERFHVIVTPWLDTTNLNKLQAELETRWGPMAQNDGMAIACKSADDSALGTLGDGRNNLHECIVGYYKSPTPPWRLAAMIAGQVAKAGSADPARPFQTLKLAGALAASIGDRLTRTERNNILTDGIATLKETADGGLQIERMVTTYKTNANGSADSSYRDSNSVFTLSFIRHDWNTHISTRYPRHKLADDGTKFGAGQAIVTPALIKAEAIVKFREWEDAGLVEGFAAFKEGMVVERNATDRNRIDILLPPNLVNQLMISATQIQFIL